MGFLVQVLNNKFAESDDGRVQLRLKVMFYPEEVDDELDSPTVKYLFWKQIWSAIQDDEIFCPAELSVFFAGHALQIEHGEATFSVKKNVCC